MSKVKECSACGQGFDEDNHPVGLSVPSSHCLNGQHEGPITRIVTSIPQAKSRGVASTHENLHQLFQVSDERVRVECKVSSGEKFFLADVLCDGGASGELTLPARKIVQLGLQPFTQFYGKGSTNDVKKSYKFEPAVMVEIKFIRDDGTEETRSENLTVSCHVEEYDKEKLLQQQQPQPLSVQISSSLAGSKRKLSDVSSSSQVTPAIQKVKLSPVLHRLSDPANANERVVLGNWALRKLHVHANFEKRVLEIKEEVEYE